MEIILNSVKNVLFGAVVLIINIPIFWSFAGFMDFVKEAIKMTGA
jgi:hypothetical protein